MILRLQGTYWSWPAMRSPKISIIVPVFNSAAYLEASLCCLLNQSESSIEVIAVNDGSTDASASILANFSALDSRLLVVNQENQGVSAARNHGLSRATGEWIAFLDADDWMAATALATWLKYAEAQNCDLVIGNGFRFNNSDTPTGKAIISQQPWGKVVSGKDWIVQSVSCNEWPHYVWLQLIRRQLITEYQLQFCENIIHEDIVWTLHLALSAQRVGFVGDLLYGYRCNPASITGNKSQAALTCRAQGYIVVIKQIVLAAKHCQDAVLRRSLYRHANRECGHLMGLIRKQIAEPSVRQRLAQEFIQQNLLSAMFAGVTNINELWRALRCSKVLFQQSLR